MPAKVLVIGYGNPGRCDDGLGPALAAALEKMMLTDVDIDSDYQLTVEDAAAVAAHEYAIFADASVNGTEPFEFRAIRPEGATLTFSTHSVEPEAVMSMARDMFKATTKGYTLGIRGYEFNEFREGLSTQAVENLRSAVNFLDGIIRNSLIEDSAEAGLEGDGHHERRQIRYTVHR